MWRGRPRECRGLVWRGRPLEWGIGIEGQTTGMEDWCGGADH